MAVNGVYMSMSCMYGGMYESYMYDTKLQMVQVQKSKESIYLFKLKKIIYVMYMWPHILFFLYIIYI